MFCLFVFTMLNQGYAPHCAPSTVFLLSYSFFLFVFDFLPFFVSPTGEIVYCMYAYVVYESLLLFNSHLSE